MDSRTRKPYPSDLTDEQWALVKPILLAYEDRTRPGPERTADLREVTNALLYQNRTGCQWAYLPHDLLPKSTVYDYFTKWRDNGLFQQVVDALRCRVRQQTPAAQPQRRLYRQSDGEEHRGRGRARLRWGQEHRRPQAPYRGGHAGVVDRRRG